ncbi:MAG: aminotransferase class I/II-fold pyridoxal phosphate-dependent enzyme [Candidatus Izimaplasma sp.]|nr:aminotransferase class I/II-fold pyridoxal phosphate-dependent enzyme [Candidatus Izimaplasma bacterium]
MSNYIKKTIKEIEISGIRQVNERANAIDDCIKLTLGELDFNTPLRIKEAAIQAIKNNQTKYTTNYGIDSLRKHIASQYDYDTKNVILTVGTTEGLAVVIKSVVDTIDEVIIPTPGYVGYAPLIHLEGGRVIELDTLKSNHIITRQSLETAYSNHTKALVITSPNNPTGNVLTPEEIKAISDFIIDKDILLISDEIYHDITFTTPFSFANIKALKERLVVLGGFSKSHAMTGFRIGYILADESLINQFIKVHQYTVTSTSTISQYAALEATQFKFNEMLDTLQKRRDYVLERLDAINIPYIKPNGAFYVFYNISDTHMTSEDYCIKLLERYKVALVPGAFFLGNHDTYVRLSYATDMNTLQRALDKIEQFHKDMS